jgi:pimeloyl-ACP methyl ester carboxylesterase
VFVAGGSGSDRTTTNLTQAVAQSCSPLLVQSVAWQHGRGRYVLDHVDHDNHIAQARCLANALALQRQVSPQAHISLVAHSAGSAVVLAATEMLPPGTVDRIVLVAPSVCESYDLRCALRNVNETIDVFTSTEDRWVLGLGVRIVGTADRACRKAAGLEGFRPVVVCPGDAALYTKLRHHPWEPCLRFLGHDGSHDGSITTPFLQAQVVPLLVK